MLSCGELRASRVPPGHRGARTVKCRDVSQLGTSGDEEVSIGASDKLVDLMESSNITVGAIEAVTAEMTIRYRSPAAPGEELAAEARVVEKRRRIFEVTGEVRGPDGRVIAEATGRYLGATPSERAELKERYGIGPGVGGE